MLYGNLAGIYTTRCQLIGRLPGPAAAAAAPAPPSSSSSLAAIFYYSYILNKWSSDSSLFSCFSSQPSYISMKIRMSLTYTQKN